MTCNNQVLKSLGSLRGVFGAEIETIDGKITINHTDEINRIELSEHLKSLGWFPVENDDDERLRMNLHRNGDVFCNQNK
jgi:hypothetical protein